MKITLITVCYNSAKTINKTLDSVASQTFKEFEHIIIDGKSQDKTLSIVKKYPHVKKIISEPDKGIYDAMNKGIKIAKGEFIGFINSDDFYTSSNVLESVVNIFNKNSYLDACYSDLVYTDQFNISKNIRYWKSSKFVFGAFSKGWCPPHPTFFVRRSVYERFGGFSSKYRIAADVELMMRFMEVHKINTHYMPQVWIKMRLGGLSNKSLINVIRLNKEILSALNHYNLPKNPLVFFLYKIISRFKQFFKKPTDEI